MLAKMLALPVPARLVPARLVPARPAGAGSAGASSEYIFQNKNEIFRNLNFYHNQEVRASNLSYAILSLIAVPTFLNESSRSQSF